jgi:predicted secreted protein
MPAVCGTYINLVDLKGGATVLARFEVNVPFTNLLMFSFFNYLGKFPSFIADITLKDVLLTHLGFVWALCCPKEVRDNKAFLQGDVLTATYGPLENITFGHRFYQVNDPGDIPFQSAGNGSTVPLTYTMGQVTIMVDSMRIMEWKSHIKGFNINDAAKAAIVADIQKLGGLVFPAQQIYVYDFNNTPTAAGLKAQQNLSLWNTNSLLVGYPKTANEITVLQNPCQTGVYLKVAKSQIPNEPYDTTSITHLQDQIGISDLDGPLNATKDYENSIILEHNKPDGTRYTNSLSDDTSYLAQFQTERSDGAFIVDGINSHGQNVPIELIGVPKYTGPNDTYYIPRAGGPVNSFKPILMECRDTFWVLDLNGLHYFEDKTPRDSQTDPRQQD